MTLEIEIFVKQKFELIRRQNGCGVIYFIFDIWIIMVFTTPPVFPLALLPGEARA